MDPQRASYPDLVSFCCSTSCASFSLEELGDWVASFFWGRMKGPHCSQAFSLQEDWKQDVKFLECSGTALPQCQK